jgi:glycerol kinase
VAFVLALDQGTTSSRALVFAEDGSIAGMGQREYPQIYPQPGWVEHDPLAIWESQLAVAREAVAAAGISASDLSGIGIANQRETTLLWERRTGNPVCNAIVWQDRRTAEACERLRAAGHAEMVRRKTGLEVDSYFSATKLAWMLDHVAGARERAERGELAFGTVDTWLVWKLTGGQGSGVGRAMGAGGVMGVGGGSAAVHATDVSNASRTMLFDIHRGEWDEELLQLVRVPREVLPEVRATDGGFGETAPAWLGARVPIRGVIGDQQAALLGQGCTKPGMVKCTYGTGCFLLMHTGTEAVESKHRLLTTVAWQRAGGGMEYALEGSVFIAGAVVQWLRDGLGIIREAAEIEPLARSVRDSGGVVFVPAFAGLGAPYWDPHARGTIVGITRGTTRAHLARAALESIAQQVADVVEAMGKDVSGAADVGGALEGGLVGGRGRERPSAGPMCVAELRVDGGACTNELLMQFQADVLGFPVVRGSTAEATARGAGMLAAGGGKEALDGRDERCTSVFRAAWDVKARVEARARWREAVRHAVRA